MRYIYDTWKPPSIAITELGFADPFEAMKQVKADILTDLSRRVYFREYLQGILLAISEGVPISGVLASVSLCISERHALTLSLDGRWSIPSSGGLTTIRLRVTRLGSGCSTSISHRRCWNARTRRAFSSMRIISRHILRHDSRFDWPLEKPLPIALTKLCSTECCRRAFPLAMRFESERALSIGRHSGMASRPGVAFLREQSAILCLDNRAIAHSATN